MKGLLIAAGAVVAGVIVWRHLKSQQPAPAPLGCRVAEGTTTRTTIGRVEAALRGETLSMCEGSMATEDPRASAPLAPTQDDGLILTAPILTLPKAPTAPSSGSVLAPVTTTVKAPTTTRTTATVTTRDHTTLGTISAALSPVRFP